MPENPQPYKGKTFVMIWANGHTKEPHQNGWSKGSFWGLGDTSVGPRICMIYLNDWVLIFMSILLNTLFLNF